MTRQEDTKVNKTVSLPIGLVNKILDESTIMGKDFSSTVVILVRWGLLKRQEDIEREDKIIRSMRKDEE